MYVLDDDLPNPSVYLCKVIRSQPVYIAVGPTSTYLKGEERTSGPDGISRSRERRNVREEVRSSRARARAREREKETERERECIILCCCR